MMDELIQQWYKKIELQKMELVKSKLIEKGFGHLIEGMEHRRFSKICAIHWDKFTYYYADNDTDEGAFIVAIKDYDMCLEYEYGISKANISFKWQDTSPLAPKTKNGIMEFRAEWYKMTDQ